MAYNYEYPYTDANQGNADWIIGKIKALGKEIEDFKILNSIKWRGAWNITKQYASWSIVELDSNGYMSIKPVPSGIEITNSDYWVLVANYSALFLEVQEKIEALENTVGNENSGIVKTVNDLEKNVIDINKKLSRKLIMIGDSYGVQNDGSINKFYWEYVRESLGLTEGVDFFKKFRAGAGFGDGEFLSNLQELEGLIDDKGSITDIFVCGGWNDSDKSQSYGTDEMYNNGVLEFNNYVKENFPNAKITLAHISWGIIPAVFSQMPVSYDRYINSANKYGWRFLTNTEYILHVYDSSFWLSDGAHPNQKGQKLLGEFLPSAFLTGSTDVHYAQESGSGVSASGIAQSISNFTLFSSINNGLSKLFSNVGNAGFIDVVMNGGSQSIDCTGITEYEIGSYNTSFYKGYTVFSSITIPITLLISGGTFINAYAKVTFDNGKVKIKPFIINNASLPATVLVSHIYFTDINITSDSFKA